MKLSEKLTETLTETLAEKSQDDQRLEQLSLDCEKIMDKLLVAPSPSRSKGKVGRRKSLIPELDNVSSSSDDSSADCSRRGSVMGSRRGSVMGQVFDDEDPPSEATLKKTKRACYSFLNFFI